MITAAPGRRHCGDLTRRRADDSLTARPPVTEVSRANRLSVDIRPVHSGDAALLATIFAGLSPSSRKARFLVPKWRLSISELRYFTEVDHHDHEAVIAVTRLRGQPVGVARFFRNRDEPTSAEVAWEVVDEWQGRGVGTLLVSGLAARAHAEGVTSFTALMSADNTRSLRLLAKLGDVTLVERDGATVSYRVALPAPGSTSPSVLSNRC